MWDWGEATTFADDEAASDRRNYQVNANGRVWGASESDDMLLWIDPVKHASGEQKVPTAAPVSDGTPSPYFGDRPLWRAAAEPRSAAVDQHGRVWFAARQRPNQNQPAFCTNGSVNKFAAYFPLAEGTKQVAAYDPTTNQFTTIDTCFSADHSDLSSDDKIFFGTSNGVGWIDSRLVDKTPPGQPTNFESVQGWCPLVLDTNGDGKIAEGWTEPDQSVDPRKDHRIRFGCYQPAVAPDGAVWCGPGGETDNRIVRLELGSNPPQTCKAEIFQVPVFRDARGSRGLDVDSHGVAWLNMTATDQFASFDRTKCKVLNGPTATGPHCPEGWKFYQIPGPPFSGPYSPSGAAPTALEGRGTARTADLMYLTTVDRFDVLGLNQGRDVPFTELSNSDALLAFLPQANEMITLRVPYPLGFFARSAHGRIDDRGAGWKGRALWSSYASYAAWHTEGGPGSKSKVVKFQMRPDPLAK
jgi:hypothetical protein